MSTWYLDHTLLSDVDSIDQQKSNLSTLFSVPHHPAEQDITRAHLESSVKGHGVSNGRINPFEYIVVGRHSQLTRC